MTSGPFTCGHAREVEISIVAGRVGVCRTNRWRAVPGLRQGADHRPVASVACRGHSLRWQRWPANGLMVKTGFLLRHDDYRQEASARPLFPLEPAFRLEVCS